MIDGKHDLVVSPTLNRFRIVISMKLLGILEFMYSMY